MNKRTTYTRRGLRSAALIGALLMSQGLALAGAKPVLKAIDPSAAKVDDTATPQTQQSAPSPAANPAANQAAPPSGSAAPGYQYQPYTPSNGLPPGYVPSTPGGPQGAPPGTYNGMGYQPPQSLAQGAYAAQRPQQGYSMPAPYGYGQQPVQEPPYGYTSAPGQQQTQTYRPPQQQWSPQYSQAPQQPTYGSYQQPAAGPPQPQPISVNPALQQFVPEFGKPLPQLPPSMSSPMAPGPGFGPGYSQQQQAQQAPQLSPEEQRCARLEQAAFGSTYPEHEVDDRLEHLEREVFGKVTGGVDTESRLARLEQKLGGQGAFGRANAPTGSTQNFSAPARPPAPPAAMPPYQPAPNQQNYPPAQQFSAGPQSYPPPSYTQQAPMTGAPGQQYPVQQFAPQQQAYQQPQQQAYQQPQQVFPAQGLPAQAPTQLPSPNGAGRNNGQQTNRSAKSQPKSQPAPSGSSDADRAASEFQTAVQSIPLDAKAGDFIAAIQHFPNNSYAHWTSFPVRVHLPLNSPDPWNQALTASLHRWDQVIPIMAVPAQEPADVEIAWINHLQPRQLGITNLEIFNGRMRVTVYLLRPTYYPPDVPEKALPAVATHELGHALGLFGHSPYAGDTMQALDFRATKSKLGNSTNLSNRDINTLRHLYEAPALPSGFQSPQPISWP